MSQVSPHHPEEAASPFSYGGHTPPQDYSHPHQYYPHQNSPYFPAAIYQPHYPHYHHAEPVVPSDYSPGSETSNDYFYAGASTAAASNSASGYHHQSSANFSFDSNDPR